MAKRKKMLSSSRSVQWLLRPVIRGAENCLPTVSRQFLTRNYPRPDCLLKCLPNCFSPTREGFLSSFKINPAVRVIARQVRDKNCLAAIFAPRHQSVSSGPLGGLLLVQQSIEKAGTVHFKKHPAQKVRTRSRQCWPKVPAGWPFPVPEIPEFVAFRDSGKISSNFSGTSRSFPQEPPNRPRKQPQPSRVFWLFQQLITD